MFTPQYVPHCFANYAPTTPSSQYTELSTPMDDVSAALQNIAITRGDNEGGLPPVPPTTPAMFNVQLHATQSPMVAPIPLKASLMQPFGRRSSAADVITTTRNSIDSSSNDGGQSNRNRSQSVVDSGNLWKTKPCAFYANNGQCRKGVRCNYIHESPKADFMAALACRDPLDRIPPRSRTRKTPRKLSASSISSRQSYSRCSERHSFSEHDGKVDEEVTPADSPSTDGTEKVSQSEDRKNFRPISWRVIGGGVMMGGNREVCQQYLKGQCSDGVDCKYAHPEQDAELDTACNSCFAEFGSPTVQFATYHPPMFQPLFSPVSPFYLSTPSPASTFASLAPNSPLPEPAQGGRRSHRRKHRQVRDLTIHTKEYEQSYKAHRILDGRTLAEIGSPGDTLVEDVPAEDDEKSVIIEENAGLFSPRTIVRPMSTPPTPSHRDSLLSVKQLFAAESP
ncbi:hypothetical protein K474DRAFT_624977 [Panus rudis PR-1116 ss-1]|nr:hypothetical protein K474DRAFT_624977 [Panus rudis PR-1116 ss-1]